ncbi:hypothetical protein P152DRAFT_259009 [Eremomyces bilateralis CBS 781.70]|uniref:NACHT domain-containing protein n=1 Tax=Eremomyces bilateralis CBS 781.70 TaxID=1392243 RepID=A0A6G1FQC7_9PEZI|nr:uncharacterized protein P152DRAFT_259009 [Eremomyces bilateralis CBS 781.70]KAF1807997.1 hypothetical protein P152DRAFT_259009 [Eremomyces bilateralis CBS 781.70]
MEPLSVTTSVTAILQLTCKFIQYLSDVKDAPKECQQCMLEASNLLNLLINLHCRLEYGQAGDPWFTAVLALNVAGGPCDQFKQALEQLQSKIEIQNGTQMSKKRLLWKFSKAEVASTLARMERLKSLLTIHTLSNTLPHLQAYMATIRETQNLQWNAQNLQQRQPILDWLSPTDFPAQQHDIISRRQEDTGRWLLDSPEFQGWLQGANRTLFCPGIPGAGKTMMAAIAIDHLYKSTQSGDIGVAYIFCNNKAKADHSARTLLAALLKQLVRSSPDMAAPVTELYDRYSERGSRPYLDDIFEALQSVCSSHTIVHIIVDALDEYEDRDGERSRIIDKLRKLQTKGDVRLLFTSRFIPGVTQKFRSSPTLELRASDEDVRRFIKGQIPRLPKCILRDDKLQRAVQDKITEAVDGMFLLARLYVDSLLDKRNRQKVMSTLGKLSKGSVALDEAYGEAIKRIDGQLAEDSSLARRALSWITYAQRKLTTQELCHALAIEPGDKALNNDNIYDIEEIISVCAGLVAVDEESNVIRLVHYTTQQYFERIRLKWNPGAQEAIAVACLTGSPRVCSTITQRITGANTYDLWRTQFLA